MRKLLAVLLLSASAFGTTITGSKDIKTAGGISFTGKILLGLNVAGAQDNCTSTAIVQGVITISVSNGSVVGSPQVSGNDCVSPQGTVYLARWLGPSGNVVMENVYKITGSTFDIGAAVPLPVTTSNVAVQDLIGLRSIVLTGNETVGGNDTITGTLTVTGLTTLSGGLASVNALINGCADANITASIARLPAAGGTIDYTGPTCNFALGTVDTGTKAVTLLFGPFTYTADHLVAEGNFAIQGAGPTATIIQSVGSNAQPLFVNVTSGLLNVRGMNINGVQFAAAAGNTSQSGMSFDLSGNTTLSVIDHLHMSQVAFTGFKGNAVHLRGSLNTGTNGSFIQFFDWDHVVAVRPSSAAEDLRLEGAVGQFTCKDCQMDGAAKGDGTNIYIGGTSNSDASFPYSVKFDNLTCQGADNCLTGNGFNTIVLKESHHENLNGAYLLQSTFTNSRDDTFIADGGEFQGVGINAGNGYILKETTTNIWGAVLTHSNFTTLHDKTCNCTSLANTRLIDNSFGQNNATPAITVGIDAIMAPAATMNVGGYHTVVLSASGTSMTTLVSVLGPGEFITFFANGTVQFATGGNITLPGAVSPLVLATGETATFTNSDFSGTNTWRLVGVNSATVTGKTLVTAGNGNAVTLLNSQDPAGNITGNGADQTVYTFTIPANQIQAGKGFRVTAAASSNNAVNCTWKLTLGSTNLITVTTTTAATFSTSFAVVNNSGVQNAQTGVGYTFEGATGSGNGTGAITSAENLANSLVLKLTANEANPNTVTPKKFLVELIQ